MKDELKITANSSVTFTVGNKKFDQAALVSYTLRRGELFQTGRVRVTNLGSTVNCDVEYVGDDVGLSVAGQFNVNAIQVVLTLDSSSTTDGIGNYTLEKL